MHVLFDFERELPKALGEAAAMKTVETAKCGVEFNECGARLRRGEGLCGFMGPESETQ